MPENVTLNTGTPWKPTTIEKLRELWAARVPANIIAHTLGRTEGEIAAKASELKLTRH